MTTRSTYVSSFAAICLTFFLSACASTVSFRADPEANGTSSVSCVASSSGVCRFNVANGDVSGAKTYKVAVGDAVSVDVPAAGVDIRGCVANKKLSSCSTVNVKPTTTATTGSKGW